MRHAEFLLNIELGSRPTTFNHYFAANLNKCKLQRFEKTFKANANHGQDPQSSNPKPSIQTITLTQLRSMTVDRR